MSRFFLRHEWGLALEFSPPLSSPESQSPSRSFLPSLPPHSLREGCRPVTSLPKAETLYRSHGPSAAVINDALTRELFPRGMLFRCASVYPVSSPSTLLQVRALFFRGQVSLLFRVHSFPRTKPPSPPSCIFSVPLKAALPLQDAVSGQVFS